MILKYSGYNFKTGVKRRYAMETKKNARLLNYLINQCKHPNGFIGNSMIEIWNRTFQKMMLWGLSNLNINRSDIILEIGCGGGMAIRAIAEAIEQGKVYGIDISKASVQKAVRVNKKEIIKGKVEILHCAVEGMPFLGQTIDKVIAIQTHIYWSEFEQSIGRIYSILKDHGSLNIICEKDKIFYHLPQYLDHDKMLELMDQSGFKDTKVYETNKWIQYQCNK